MVRGQKQSCDFFGGDCEKHDLKNPTESVQNSSQRKFEVRKLILLSKNFTIVF